MNEAGPGVVQELGDTEHLQVGADTVPARRRLRGELRLEAHEGLRRPAPKTRGAKKGSNALAQFAQQLLTDHPQEASRAFIPLLSLLEELLDEGAVVVEWGDRLEAPEAALLSIEHLGGDRRRLRVVRELQR